MTRSDPGSHRAASQHAARRRSTVDPSATGTSSVHPTQLGIAIHMDLPTNQQVQHPGTRTGTLWVDGTLYSTALPQRLRHIAAPSLTQSSAEKALDPGPVRQTPAVREAAADRPHPKGVQRPRGPARRGKFRCPNVPKSMRGPHATPLSGCTPGEPCGCGLTVPVHRHEYQVVRQHLPWQSTAWFDSYGRRVGIESLNASIRGHRANINRGYIRVVGLAPVTTLLAFGLAGMNTRILNAWYTSRGLPEPWATFLAEPSDERVPSANTAATAPNARGGPPTPSVHSPHEFCGDRIGSLDSAIEMVPCYSSGCAAAMLMRHWSRRPWRRRACLIRWCRAGLRWS